MSVDAFELLALTMRYIFAGLMLLIVLRAARGALVDSRRAARLRRLSPMTGISGELVVLDPLPKLPRGRRSHPSPPSHVLRSYPSPPARGCRFYPSLPTWW